MSIKTAASKIMSLKGFQNLPCNWWPNEKKNDLFQKVFNVLRKWLFQNTGRDKLLPVDWLWIYIRLQPETSLSDYCLQDGDIKSFYFPRHNFMKLHIPPQSTVVPAIKKHRIRQQSYILLTKVCLINWY